MSDREMHGVTASEAAPPPPLPPEFPDLYGKHRELAKIQVLQREIGFLEEEVISIEGHQPASRACKEVVDFVTCNADPLIPISKTKKNHGPRCFWKRLCGLSCFNVSWSCCSSNPEKSQCCDLSSCWNRKCFNSKCSCSSCLTSSTTGHRCCTKVNMCSCYNKTRCYSYCFCY